ncbi:pyridoxal-dependent decarboxylase, exosortase A system-associated [Thalassotalea sp. ND16A]|uniref:pyridoxal-dependent decarboxylase, exosortase A system-associated n=1 Tax=Thalassotalea sp. ND16A TaxID=1535422 RepID=UPI00051A2102|nr:pyridoxal-dependent decarboxylase, exosortase A system-associated [Thalassotalea sp. ND16A]KGJ95939.1 Diaminopimelate decarboxylase [Thalassotalea sp. ND16A]
MNKTKPRHERHRLINTATAQLLIGEKTLSEIEQLLDGTPFYAYDRKLIEQRVTQLTQTLPQGISLHYAIKANPYPPVVSLLANLVNGFDVASRKEMLLAMQTGMPAANISFAGPGKSKKDLAAAIIAGITLHVESINELNRAIVIGKKLAMLPNIAIRVNPAFELKASGMKMAGGAKQFGIDEEELPAILSSLDPKSVNLRGFHIFTGSQNLNEQAIIDAHQQTFELALKLMAVSPQPVDYINIGGGLGIPYFPGDKSLSLTAIADNLQDQLQHLQKSATGVEVIMELGRYLVGEAGVYVSKIVDKKTSRNTTYLICDGGLHHHLANSGNFGQVLRKNFPVLIGNKLTSTQAEEVDIVGPLCTPLDVLGSKIELPKAEVGDYVVILQSGAYGATASPQAFLSQPGLAEILL